MGRRRREEESEGDNDDDVDAEVEKGLRDKTSSSSSREHGVYRVSQDGAVKKENRGEISSCGSTLVNHAKSTTGRKNPTG